MTDIKPKLKPGDKFYGRGGPGKKRGPRPLEVRVRISQALAGRVYSEASKRKMQKSQQARRRRERAGE